MKEGQTLNLCKNKEEGIKIYEEEKGIKTEILSE